MAKVKYFVYRKGDRIGRIVKFEDGEPYAYMDGEWKFAPQFAKILNDATDDAEEISEAEAKELIK